MCMCREVGGRGQVVSGRVGCRFKALQQCGAWLFADAETQGPLKEREVEAGGAEG